MTSQAVNAALALGQRGLLNTLHEKNSSRNKSKVSLEYIYGEKE